MGRYLLFLEFASTVQQLSVLSGLGFLQPKQRPQTTVTLNARTTEFCYTVCQEPTPTLNPEPQKKSRLLVDEIFSDPGSRAGAGHNLCPNDGALRELDQTPCSDCPVFGFLYKGVLAKLPMAREFRPFLGSRA